MATLNGVGRSAIDPRDLSTFDEPPKHKVVHGPVRLYRFGKPRGKWWFDSSLFNTLREDYYDAVYGDAPRVKDDDGTRFVRYALAVSREWNKFAHVSILTLHDGEALDCFIGPTSPQPEWQKQKDGPSLGGGFPQYVVYEIDMVPSGNFSETTMVALYRKWG